MAGLKSQVSKFDPCLNFVCRARGRAVGFLAAQIDEFCGRGERGVFKLVHQYLDRRLRGLRV